MSFRKILTNSARKKQILGKVTIFPFATLYMTKFYRNSNAKQWIERFELKTFTTFKTKLALLLSQASRCRTNSVNFFQRFLAAKTSNEKREFRLELEVASKRFEEFDIRNDATNESLTCRYMPKQYEHSYCISRKSA